VAEYRPYCDEHVQTKESIARLSQKSMDICKTVDKVQEEIGKLDVRVNKRITETSEVINKRIDDTMVTIKRLFVAIMVAIIGSGIGFFALVMHLVDKMR